MMKEDGLIMSFTAEIISNQTHPTLKYWIRGMNRCSPSVGVNSVLTCSGGSMSTPSKGNVKILSHPSEVFLITSQQWEPLSFNHLLIYSLLKSSYNYVPSKGFLWRTMFLNFVRGENLSQWRVSGKESNLAVT